MLVIIYCMLHPCHIYHCYCYQTVYIQSRHLAITWVNNCGNNYYSYVTWTLRHLKSMLTNFFQQLVQRSNKKRYNSTSLALCARNPPVVGAWGFPHKAPIMQKVLPYHDLVMSWDLNWFDHILKFKVKQGQQDHPPLHLIVSWFACHSRISWKISIGYYK